MFIKIKGSFTQDKNENLVNKFLININHIDSVQIFNTPAPGTYNKLMRTTMGLIYTDDDVPALIEKRMATPFSEPFLAVEKQYRDPVLPQDLDCLAEFSDNNKDWEEGYLSAFSRNADDQMEWGGRSLNKQFRYYKRCRIPV